MATKHFCKYSGVILQTNNYLNNLPVSKERKIRAWHHEIFDMPIGEIINLMTCKPYENMSTTQRHLIAIAALKLSKTVNIKFPITDQTLTPRKTLELFPHLITLLTRIGIRYSTWEDMIKEGSVPKLEVRADNYTELNILSFIKDQVLPVSSLLIFQTKNQILSRVSKEHQTLNEQIDLERQLKEQLKNQRKSKKYSYKNHMGLWVLNELTRTLKKTHNIIITEEEREKAVAILTTKPKDIKQSSRDVEALRKKIVENLVLAVKNDGNGGKEITATIYDPDDYMARSYISLTVGWLDTVIDYMTSINIIFGQKTKKVPASLPENFPVEYEVLDLESHNPFVIDNPINPNVEKSTNPAVQKILEKRRQRNSQDNTQN